jgi:hypothetical protein
MTRRIVVILCAVVLVFAGVRAGVAKPAAEDTSAFAAADAQILSEVREHSEAMQNSEYLGDSIGPRLTGSPQLKQANDWTAAKFREYGLTNVHLEPWTIAHSWTRGTARARIVAPTEHPLTIASAGWAPGTSGVVRGPVVYVDIKKDEDFEKYRGKLKGAIVIAQEPASLSPPKPDEPFSEVIRPMQTPPPLKGQPVSPSPFAAMMAVARKRTEFYKQERGRGPARFEQTAWLAEHDRNRRREVRDWSDSHGVHHWRRLPDALPDAKAQPGASRNRDDQFVQRQARGGLQHGRGNQGK